jgi:hypothetical protein
LTSQHFVFSVVLIFVGIILIAIGLCLDASRVTRIIVLALSSVGLFLLSKFIVFAPAPLVVRAVFNVADYVPGTTMAGIPWEPDFVELQVFLSNPTNDSYTDVSVILNTDMMTRAIGQVSDIPGVTFPKAVLSRPVAEWTDDKGRHHQAPVIVQGGLFKMQCEKIPPKSAVAAIVALSNPDDGQGKRRPKFLSIDGSYKTGMRTRNIITKLTDF